ncbi:gluconokinase [Cereibacter sp. SYSU M97828]|nr:gluconokinase [Cereibacter flavus]
MQRAITRMVLMGVSGSGKTTVGRALSDRTGVPYLDGDDLHPPANIAKMAAGEPLTDADRAPWLEKVADALGDAPVIVGCSALKRRYRDVLRRAGPVLFVHLSGRPEVLAARMAGRTGHFMPGALLQSQLAALEPPGTDEDAITVDIDQPLQAIVDAIATR